MQNESPRSPSRRLALRGCGRSSPDPFQKVLSPEITYEKMITLINFRKERLLENKSFNDENDLNSHIKIIEDEIRMTDKNLRMRELKNWLDLIS